MNELSQSIKGEVKVGKKFEAQIGTMKFKPTVLVFEKERELTWLGRLLIPGIFDGKHTFRFTQNVDGTTRMVQSELFTGILVPFMKKKLNTDIKRDFEAMNAKLKELAETA